MADPEKPRGNEKDSEEQDGQRHRKHGYRGYPNTGGAGDVHTGSGFGGAGSISRSGTPGDGGVISERTRDDAEEKE